MTENATTPTTNDAVHVSFLLDRSGSMAPIRNDVIGGFNQFLREQQARSGVCRMTLVQFDSQAPFEVLVDAADVRDVPPLDAARYEPRAGTPLLDALGELLEHAERRARGRDEDAVVVVFTDGEENASRSWQREALFERIAGLKARGWAFVFLGANQDSYAEAGELGFATGSTSNWKTRSSGSAFAQLNRSVGSYRGKDRAARVAQSGDFFEGVKEAETDSDTSSKKGDDKIKH
jgi:uncharacterized protein YegL